MPRIYFVNGGSEYRELRLSETSGSAFIVTTTEGVAIPLVIRTYKNALGPGQVASTGNTLIHARAVLHASASPDVTAGYPGEHVLDLTFAPSQALLDGTGTCA